LGKPYGIKLRWECLGLTTWELGEPDGNKGKKKPPKNLPYPWQFYDLTSKVQCVMEGWVHDIMGGFINMKKG
jgi:hypothetical protein